MVSLAARLERGEQKDRRVGTNPAMHFIPVIQL